MNVAHKMRRKPRFDTQMPASLIAGLVLIMALLLWSLRPQPSRTRPPRRRRGQKVREVT